MKWDLRGVVLVVGCVLLAGLIGSLVPEWLPSYRAVRPDADGVARTDELDAWLVDAYVTETIVGDYGDRFTTEERFVVVQIGARPHGETAIISTTLVTADGLEYGPIFRAGIDRSVHVPVGQQVLVAQVFEVPTDRLDGLKVAVGTMGIPGVQPVPRQAELKLASPLPVGQPDAEIPAAVFEAAP